MKFILNLSLLAFVFLLFVSCDKDVYQGINEPARKDNSILVLSSYPSGSAIFVDGKNSGLTTPDSVPHLSVGEHTIKLRNHLFEDTTFTVSLAENENRQMLIDYYLNPGNFGVINCYCTPKGASIFLDDSATGKVAPYTFTGQYPGNHKIKCTYPEHRPDSLTFFVKGGSGVSLFIILEDTSQVVSYQMHNSPIASDFINSVAVDNNGVVWAASLERGLIRFDGKNWSVFNTKNSPLPYDLITCVVVDNQNRILAGTSGGFAIYSNDSWTIFNTSNSNLPHNYVTSIAPDDKGNIWIGTQNGLAKLSDGNIEAFTTSNSGLAGNAVSSVLVSGNYVYAGNYNGISRFDGTNWTQYHKVNSNLSGNTVSCLCADNEGYIYAGLSLNTSTGEPGGGFYFNGSQWREIPTFIGITIKSLYCDKNGIVWAGAQGGLLKIKGRILSKYFTKYNSKLIDDHVRNAVMNDKNQLWIATYGGGLFKFKEGSY